MGKIAAPHRGLAISLAAAFSTAPPLALAALLLAARAVATSLDLEDPSVEAILSATHTSKSRAYELAVALCGLLPTLARPPGRPRAPERTAPAKGHDLTELTRATLAYVMSHPGCVARGERQHYSDTFRGFVLDARVLYPSCDLEDFALAVQVPLGTLRDWLHAPAAPAPPSPTAKPESAVADTREMQLVLDAWSRWSGSFVDFCEHVRRDLRVPFGRSLVARILDVHRARTTHKRPGRSPDERALRGSFRTFFPGAQWVGDGMQVPIVVDTQRFVFNVELNVDAHAGAFVGASVRDEEDSIAVVDAFHDGIRATGERPLALLLDNRPSNHTSDVDAALGDTLRIRATALRPQNKAHVEGAFGLFSQVLPPLVFDTSRTPREVARRFLGVVFDVWARTTNHRPRRDRGGRSRVELYAERPTAEQIEQARRELRETAARQERARRTLEARRRPEVLAFLDQHFARLDLLDPERHQRVAIAGYPFSAIVDGVAVFGAKRRALTLPDGVDARYLLGIVRNISSQYEAQCIAEEMLRLRREVRDQLLVRLEAERGALRATGDLPHVVDTCVRRALEIPPSLERTFWLEALGDLLRALPDDARDTLALRASQRIHANFDASLDERRAAAQTVLARATPIA